MKKGKDYIIFALDLPTLKEARRYVLYLSGHVAMFKVGLELFVRSGPDIIHYIRKCGKAGIFLDLKLHDIPATVSRTMKIIAEMGVDFATVHCGESENILSAAVSSSKGKVGILAVTVLTSITANDISSAGFEKKFISNPGLLVLNRTQAAKRAGCAGVVCSGLEVKAVKENFGKNFLTVTPGIRPEYEYVGNDDQQRTTTPSQAILWGSDYLVIGRPIRDAENPVEAAKKIAREIETAVYPNVA